MRKILKKVSASLILILMIFSVSFNVLTYAAESNDNQTIQRGKFKLIVPNQMVDEVQGGYYFTTQQWIEFLDRYDEYYNQLRNLTGIDPIINNGKEYITIDLTHDTLPSTVESVAGYADRSTLEIFIRKDKIRHLCETNNYKESDVLTHEMCHLFQQGQDWNFNTEISVLLEQAIICNGKQIIRMDGSEIFADILGFFEYCSQHKSTTEYKQYNEIAYKILSKVSISDIQRAIMQNNQNTASTQLERFEKFMSSLGQDIGELELDNGQTIYEYMGGTVESTIFILVTGNKSNKTNTIDFTKGDNKATVNITVNANKQPMSVKARLSLKGTDNELYLKSINGNQYIYEGIIDIENEEENLRKDPRLHVTIQDSNSNNKTWNIDLTVLSEEKQLEIKKMQVTQPNTDVESGIFDNEQGDIIKITFEISGIEKKEDLKIRTLLKGFEAGTEDCSVELNEETKVATVIIIMKKQEDIELTNGEIEGKIEVIVDEEKLTETFGLEITNGNEKEEEIVIKYYDYDEKKYVTIDEDTKELNITADGRYIFSVKMSGIEEERHVFAVIGDNEYVFSNSNGSYVKGITFKQNGTYNIKLCVSNEIVKELKLNLNIVSENKHLVLYALKNKDDLDIPEGWDQGATEEYSFGNHGTGGEDYFIFTDVNDSKKSYFCFEHGASLDPSDHYVLFDAEEYTGLEDEHKLILAYLAETNEFSSESDRYAAQQYYIWLGVKGQQVNCGKFTELLTKLMTLPNNKNDYIDLDEGTITVNGETKKINLDTFKAIEYIARAQYSYDGTVFELGDYVQPFFTYIYETEDADTPGLQLKKVDENKNPLQATFRICKKDEQGKWTYYSEEDEYTTDEETGFTDIISLEEGEYFVYEILAPGGYEPTSQYAIIEVNKEGKISEYHIYEANSLNDDGSVKTTNSNDLEPTEELEWNEISDTDDLDETEELDPSDDLEQIEELEKSKLILEVINKCEIPPIKIIKVDQDGNKIGGKGGSFQVTIRSRDGQGNLSKTYELNEKGEIDISLVEEGFTGTELEITVEEIFAPEGYDKLENNTNTFSIKLSENNEWEVLESVEDENFNVSVSNSLIEMRIRNNKEEPDKPKPEPPQPPTEFGIKVPLLMYIDGTVWLDGVSGKQSESNNMLGDSVDKNLEGILVQLYEEDGITPASVADAGDLERAIETIKDLQNINGNNANSLDNISKTIRETYKTAKEKLEKDKNTIVDYGEYNRPITQYEKDVSYAKKAYENIIDKYNSWKDFYNKYFDAEGNFKIDKYDFDGYDRYLEDYNSINKRLEDLYLKDNIPIEIQLIEKKINAHMNIINKQYPVSGALNDLEKSIKSKNPNFDFSSSLIYQDEVVNSETENKLRNHLEELQKLQEKGIYNTTVTDENGNFKFYGLNPDKKYVVKFTYNGMRYEDVEVTYKVGSTVSSDILEKTSKATENEQERQKLTNRFSEIGTYPYNYPSKVGTYNAVFTQDQVNSALSEGKQKAGDLITLYLGRSNNGEIYNNLNNYITDSNYSTKGSIVQFIKDTTISARIEAIGDILKTAEDVVKSNNEKIDQKTKDILYPVVEKVEIGGEYNSYDDALNAYNNLNDDKVLGYVITCIGEYNEIQTFIPRTSSYSSH